MSHQPETRLPLSALLSHLLVAFIVEFDNEVEHQMPHSTTQHGRSSRASPAPWLISMVMWSTCLRFVPENGITVRELERLAGTGTNLPGMQRWGYVYFQPNPTDPRPKPPRSEWLIRPTPAGRMAQQILPPLFDIVEHRWRDRFGEKVESLRTSLQELIAQFEFGLPETLPILGYGLVNHVKTRPRQPTKAPATLTLPALLSQVLLAFALEFEGESEVSIAIGANVLRVATQAVPVRDLPRLSSVSKEAIAMALSFLSKRGYALVEPESPGSRLKAVRLTAKGHQARDVYNRLVWEIEDRWSNRFGNGAVTNLRQRLEQIAADPEPLLKSMQPYPEGWRASLPKPAHLPHFPMILHRGGYPDGS